MATRMQKYYEDGQNLHSRTERNQDLYKEIANSEIDRFELSSNATVLSEAKNNIDIEKIKKILDNKYKELPKRRTIKIETEEPKEEKVEDTKEYDINVILEKARGEKEDNYDDERFKKIRDTQYDILNKLDLEEKSFSKDKEENPEKNKQDDLMELINTITAKELENSKKDDLDPLDILTDLKGEGEVTSPIVNDVLSNEDPEIKRMIETSEKEQELINSVVVDSVDNIDKSFFTNTTGFTESDFDDFNDLKAEVSSHKTIIIIIVVILMIVIVVAIILGLNKFLDLGLF